MEVSCTDKAKRNHTQMICVFKDVEKQNVRHMLDNCLLTSLKRQISFARFMLTKNQ